MLFDLDRWEEIWETITRNKWRSFMTAMGVFWAIFMFVIMSGAGLGLERLLLGNITVSTNTAFFWTSRTGEAYKGMPSGRWWSAKYPDIKAMKDIEGIKYITCAQFVGDAQITVGTRSTEGSIEGYEPEYQFIDRVDMIFGRYVNDIDMTQSRKVCTIGDEIYNNLFPEGGDPSGTNIRIGQNTFMIAGVHKAPESNVNMGGDKSTIVMIPLSTMQKMYNLGTNINQFLITAEDGYNVVDIEEKVKERLRALYTISPTDKKAIGSFNLQEMFLSFNNLFLGISILIWIVGMGTLLAGVIGISNIMLIVVKERTQEIGVRRALGAKPKDIIFQIMSESFVLTFITGVAALGVSVGILSLVESITAASAAGGMGQELFPQISFNVAISSAIIIIISGFVAGIIPTIRAISIKAVDAIREE